MAVQVDEPGRDHEPGDVESAVGAGQSVPDSVTVPPVTATSLHRVQADRDRSRARRAARCPARSRAPPLPRPGGSASTRRLRAGQLRSKASGPAVRRAAQQLPGFGRVPEFAGEAGGTVLAGELAGDLLGVAPEVRGVRGGGDGGGEPAGAQPGSRDGGRPGAECPETGGPEGLVVSRVPSPPECRPAARRRSCQAPAWWTITAACGSSPFCGM